MSRIVAHTMATPELEPLEALDLAQQLWLAGIELVCQEGYRCGIPPNYSFDETLALARAAAHRGLRIIGLTPYAKGLNSASTDDRKAAMDELRDSARRAAELGCQGMRVLAGSTVSDDNRDDALQRLAESLNELGEFAAELGVAVQVENHMDTMAISAEATMAIVEASGCENVGVLYDQANLAIMGAEPPAEALAVQAGAIRHVHVKDFVPAGSDRIPKLPGEGSVPWADVVAGLVAQGYDGYYSLEYEKRWFPNELPPAEIGLAAARDHLLALLDRVNGEVK